MGSLSVLVVLGLVLSVGALVSPPGSGESCQPEKMTVYKMILHTFWTRDKFPKHYPDWRPPAQWSQVYGQSHDQTHVLFHLGSRVSSAVRAAAEGAAETGARGVLDALGVQGSRGVLDAFTAPAIAQGSGRAEADFTVDGNHSKVSVMSRMIPSPDWFVGIDSFDLCVNGNWLDSITIEVDPIDAGTDNGFTFTAPNWPTQPQGVAFRLTSRYPAHPAGSFYYPHIKRLPPIATFQFVKLREYELSESFQHSTDEHSYDVLRLEPPAGAGNSIDVLDGNSQLSLAIEQERAEREPHYDLPPRILDRDGGYRTTPDNKYTASPGIERNTSISGSSATTLEPRENNELPRGDKAAVLSSIARSYRGKRRKHRKGRTSRDCRVSDWGEWSACSRSCGIGETRRLRRVLRKARRGGAACAPLLQTRWCGSARDCPKGYFNW